jgi:hypothetical protein
MKVYIGYECYYNFCDVFMTAVKVFDCEVKALIWVEEVPHTEQDFRTYEEMEVE